MQKYEGTILETQKSTFNIKSSQKLTILIIITLIITLATIVAIFQPTNSDAYRNASLLDIFYPIEINPDEKLPYIGANLSKIFVSKDGKNIWACGWSGTIVKSIDGGDNWKQINSGTNESLISLYFSIDNKTGWACGDNGAILKSTDGGDNWKQINSGTNESLTSIYFSADNKTGWICGSNGTILKSTDGGGNNWAKMNYGTNERLNSIYFSSDNKTAWAYNRTTATIVKSIDGGNNWTETNYIETYYLKSFFKKNIQPVYSIYFTNNNKIGWAFCITGTILKSIDGGNNWTETNYKTTADLASIYLSNDNKIGWACGYNGTILKSIDGGETWSKKGSGTDEWLTSIYFSSDNKTGWACGYNGTILKSIDGGDYWYQIRKKIIKDTFVSKDNKNIWILKDTKLFKSSNSGTSFIKINYEVTSDINSIYFSSDNKIGWSSGKRGIILKSKDGGINWNEVKFVKQPQLYSIYFSNSEIGWSCGIGSILKSTDEGDSWTKTNSNSNEYILSSIYFSINNQIGWVCGLNGIILKSIDSGYNWKKINTRIVTSLSSIYFLSDNKTGWSCGDNGTILKSIDGGDIWNKINSGTNERLSSINFLSDNKTGWICGKKTIFKSTDSGDTWQPKEIKINGEVIKTSLIKLNFIDANNGLVVSQSGSIYQTKDGGDTWQKLNNYAKYPAGWYYIVLLGLIIWFFTELFKKEVKKEEEKLKSIENVLISDKPLENGMIDYLNFAPTAEGIAKFIRNRNTKPPLTLAITGKWGTGKSSMMSLINAFLKKHNFYPVWFNAWHHQNEEQLLNALLENIKFQAIPPWGNLWYFWFHIRLLCLRLKRNWFLYLIIGLIYIVTLGIIILNLEFISTNISNLFNFKDNNIIINVIIIFISSMPAILAIFDKLKPFSSLSEFVKNEIKSKFGIRYSTENTGFRYKFAKEFKEVTKALGDRNLVIIIDDLDRCKPNTVVTVLEAINFLVSAGDCFFILGLDKDRVEHCVGLDFKDLVEKYDECNNNSDNTNKLKDFAKKYMEKLINIEIPVPIAEKENSTKLLTSDKKEDKESKIKIENPLKKFFLAAKVVLVIYIFIVGFFFFNNIISKSKEYIQKEQQNEQNNQKLGFNKEINKDIFENDLFTKLIYEDDKNLVKSIFTYNFDKKKYILKESLKIEEINHFNYINKQLNNTINLDDIKSFNLSYFNQIIGNIKDKKELDFIKNYYEKTNNNYALKEIKSFIDRDKIISIINNAKPTPVTTINQITTTTIQSPNSSSFENGQTKNSNFWILLGILVIFIILVFIIPILVYISKKLGEGDIIDDSDNFKEALKIWAPLINFKHNTPRAIKRFLNKVRYFSMRSYKEEEKKFGKKFSEVFNPKNKKPPQRPDILSDEVLVTLFALYYFDESWIRDDKIFEIIIKNIKNIKNVENDIFPHDNIKVEMAKDVAKGNISEETKKKIEENLEFSKLFNKSIKNLKESKIIANINISPEDRKKFLAMLGEYKD
ncbi:MAG: hypothetical protein A2Y34_04820 [Spirochaetes bacterium GWC1_27_15]|nr:MAG: hypothetical protein A2Z98_18580 [Spirochaetes bacterium GWB1_27_13]OHD20228.1 MAG: hypothetical protein A2Y34_04820 [Spirochaetes bacterium GWC1_27_15]